jgi:hypothetical protein
MAIFFRQCDGVFCSGTRSKQYVASYRNDVARRCMDVIANFTPERAATQILRGCVSILNTPQ